MFTAGYSPPSGVPSLQTLRVRRHIFLENSGLLDNPFLSRMNDPRFHWLSKIPCTPLGMLVQWTGQ